ncbi:MAG: DNA polymerase III subunit delta' [Neisseria sp.]|nr:DNA polymerase III subunit delta' [Neisseria sp.]
MIYPWHENEWRQLAAHWARLPHALLVSGRRNTGKNAFALHLAQALLCESPSGQHDPCGVCPSCHLFGQNSHPDFYRLSPDAAEGGAHRLQQIKIDDVRAVIARIQLSAVRGGRRIVLISPAECMNPQSANSLLKILEEPPENAAFLLVSHERDRLLPTIKSRCRQIILPAPDRETAWQYVSGRQNAGRDLLAFHGYAPLFPEQPEQDSSREGLLRLLASPRLLALMDYAADFDRQKWPLADFLDWMQKWLADIALAQQGMPPLYYPAHTAAAVETAAKTTPAALFALDGRIKALIPYGRHTLNVKLQLEYLLTEYLLFWQNKK